MKEYLITPIELDDIFALIGTGKDRTVYAVNISAVSISELLVRIEQEVKDRKTNDVLIRIVSPAVPEITMAEIDAIMNLLQRHCPGNVCWDVATTCKQANLEVFIMWII